MRIEDGVGKGTVAEVDDENRLIVKAVTVTEEHYINNHDGNAYNMTFQNSAISGNSPFFYIKNTDDMWMICEGFNVFSTYPGLQYIEISLGDTGTAAAGSAGTPVNMNAGSGKLADVTCRYGNKLTGLTQGNIIERHYVASGGSSKSVNFDMDVILPKNTTLTFRGSPNCSGQRMDCTLDFYFHE